MSRENDTTAKKWNIIKDQLVALCSLNKLPKHNEDFAKLLSEHLQLKNLNSQLFASLCYYVLGIICPEERDKLIHWPLINIQTHSKFRKGVSALVKKIQDKYPWANLKKLPESYFVNPHGYQSRIVDFLSKLINIAIHVALNDPKILFMHSGEGLNAQQINMMKDIIFKATQEEEELIRQNVVCLKELEEVKNEICNKCIGLKQINDELVHQLARLTSHAVSEGFVPACKKVELTDLKKERDKKISELNVINEELSEYSTLCQELLKKIQAFEDPVSLSGEDFGCQSSPPDLIQATSRACEDLYKLFQYVKSKTSTKEEEESFYEQLNVFKNCLLEEKEALVSFLSKMSSLS